MRVIQCILKYRRILKGKVLSLPTVSLPLQLPVHKNCQIQLFKMWLGSSLSLQKSVDWIRLLVFPPHPPHPSCSLVSELWFQSPVDTGSVLLACKSWFTHLGRAYVPHLLGNQLPCRARTACLQCICKQKSDGSSYMLFVPFTNVWKHSAAVKSFEENRIQLAPTFVSGKLRVSKEFLTLRQKLSAKALEKKQTQRPTFRRLELWSRAMLGAMAQSPGTDMEGADREDESVAWGWVAVHGAGDTLGGQWPWLPH